MKELQITLYEIFGYLVPGFVLSCATTMAYWTIFEDNHLVLSTIEAPFLFLILVVSYLAGHVAQSLANLVLFKRSNSFICFRSGKKGIGDALITEAKQLTKDIIDSTSTSIIRTETILEVCDAMIEHRGSPQTREVYLYREGFYRGMFISLLILSITLAIRSLSSESVFKYGDFFHAFTGAEMAFLSVLAAVISTLFFFRFRRFGKYLITHKIASALVLRYLDRDKYRR